MEFCVSRQKLAKLYSTKNLKGNIETLSTQSVDRDHLTSPGSALGTLAYMSPEQVRGLELDPRTDLFSFGAVLYEMCTGRLPFHGESTGALCHAILNRAPVPAIRLNQDIPPKLEDIINKTLEKNRNLRYQHASDVRSDLRRLKRDIESGQENRDLESLRELRHTDGALKSVLSALIGSRFRRYVLIGTACALILGALTLGMIEDQEVWHRFFGPNIPQQKNLVVLPFTDVNGQASEQVYCDGLTETVTTKLAHLRSLQVPLALEVRNRHVANIQDARKQFGANLVLAASWQRVQNSARINLSLVDAKTGQQLRTDTITEPAGNLFQLQDQVVLKASRMLELQLSPSSASSLTAHDTTMLTAYDFYVQGIGYLQRYERPENIENSITLFQRAIKEDPTYAQAQAGLAQAYCYKYSATKDPQWAVEAKEAVRRARGLNSRLPEVQLAIAQVNLRTGSYGDAVSGFQSVLELDPGNTNAYLGLGVTYDLLGQTEAAEKAFREAIDVSPQCWGCYNQFGIFLNNHARYAEAARAWEKVTELTPDNVWGYMNVGVAYFNSGQFGKAQDFFLRGLQISPNDPDLYSNAGTVCFFLRNFAEGVTYSTKAIDLAPQKYDYWGNLADAYRMIPGKSAQSARAYRNAIHLAEAQLSINPINADVLSSLALYYARTNNLSQAKKYLDGALKEKPEDVDILRIASLVHLEEGDRKGALVWLERSVKAGYTREQLVANPEFESLHSDPQFERLAKEAKSYQ